MVRIVSSRRECQAPRDGTSGEAEVYMCEGGLLSWFGEGCLISRGLLSAPFPPCPHGRRDCAHSEPPSALSS